MVFGQQQQIVIQNINDQEEAGKPRWDWQAGSGQRSAERARIALAESRLSDAYRITDKQERVTPQVDVIKSETIATRWLPEDVEPRR
ncbi:hypothetical protein MJ579_25470 [Klebsiella pneumoniae]|nr:hypothetical protein MJ579_25470 [Klebsiella pneumoniae]